MRKKQAPELAEAVEAVALMDDAAHGLSAGRVVVVPPAQALLLKAAGLIDDHPDAVAYAKANA